MKADFQSYAQASSRCLWGLLLQFFMGLGLLIYSIYAGDLAARSASAFVFVGVPVWLLLLIVFDQHRRERIEALESESLAASDAAGSSVFEHAGEELRVAARRLHSMHKLVLPIASLIIGAVLIGVGIWHLESGLTQVRPSEFKAPTERGWALAIGLFMGFVGFVFARYVSGMAKQPVWSNLRAGGAYMVGASLVGLAMTVGNFVDIAGSDVVLRYLNAVYAIAMIVLGVEVMLNLVLNLYRPRKTGDVPRPAFDSRVLSFVAAPDRIAESIGEAINYQFGFNVSSSWFYKLLSRDLPVFVAIGLLSGWMLTMFAVVEPDQLGLRIRQGRLVEANLKPGLYFKRPWPFESIEVPEYIVQNNEGRIERRERTVTSLREIDLGTQPETEGEDQMRPRLWTGEVARNESYIIVRPTITTRRGEGVGKELSLLAVEIPLHYAVRNAEAYELLGPPEQRRYYLGQVARREATWYLATLTVDDLLSTRRIRAADELKRRIEQAFTRINPLGEEQGPVVEVLSVGIQGVRPPQPVARDFEVVVEAEEKARERLSAAREEAITTRTAIVGSVELADRIIEELDVLDAMVAAGRDEQSITEQKLKVQGLIEQAGGQAATILAEARAGRLNRHMTARASLIEYNGLVGTYLAAPAVFKARHYYAAWAQAIADGRVVITNISNVETRFDLEEQTSGANIFGDSEDGGGG
jgi:regulator of protease activity HflC (stomatin/prohibitin superfamily)